MKLTLPFPPKELNPNSRLHFMKVARFKKSYRQACWALAKEAGFNSTSLAGCEKAEVHLTFYPPDRRHRDMDNMLASMKSGLDGIAEALHFNDKGFKVTLDVSDDIGGMVKVSITGVGGVA